MPPQRAAHQTEARRRMAQAHLPEVTAAYDNTFDSSGPYVPTPDAGMPGVPHQPWQLNDTGNANSAEMYQDIIKGGMHEHVYTDGHVVPMGAVEAPAPEVDPMVGLAQAAEQAPGLQQVTPGAVKRRVGRLL